MSAGKGSALRPTQVSKEELASNWEKTFGKKAEVVVEKKEEHPDYNFKHISNSFYLVRTQAGFKQAVNHFTSNDCDKLQLNNYPKSYPSVISLSYGYNGNIFIKVNTVHIKKLLSFLND